MFDEWNYAGSNNLNQPDIHRAKLKKVEAILSESEIKELIIALADDNKCLTGEENYHQRLSRMEIKEILNSTAFDLMAELCMTDNELSTQLNGTYLTTDSRIIQNNNLKNSESNSDISVASTPAVFFNRSSLIGLLNSVSNKYRSLRGKQIKIDNYNDDLSKLRADEKVDRYCIECELLLMRVSYVFSHSNGYSGDWRGDQETIRDRVLREEVSALNKSLKNLCEDLEKNFYQYTDNDKSDLTHGMNRIIEHLTSIDIDMPSSKIETVLAPLFDTIDNVKKYLYC